MNTNTNTPTTTSVNTRPKRPLSAFNLFYRFKRQQVLHALASKGNNLGPEEISRLIEAPAGLEHRGASSTPMHDDLEALNALRRSIIINELKPNMNARDTKKRSHRKDHGMKGAISFVELGKIMNSSWKKCDDVAKAVFDELAQEGRDKYRVLVQEFNAKKMELGLTTKTSKKVKKTSNKKKDKKRTRDGDESPTTTTTKQSKKKQTQSTKNDEAIAVLPPPPLLKSEVSSGSEMSERELAETMLQLQSSTPPLKKQRKMSGPLKKRWLTTNEVASPSLLDLLSSNNGTQNVVGDNSSVVPRMMNTTPPVYHQPRAAVHPPHLPRAGPITISPTQQGFLQSTLQSNEAELMSRVRALEEQLAQERIRVQNMAALEEQVLLKQRAQEDLNKSMFFVIAKNRLATTALTSAPAPQPPIQQQQRPVIQNDGLWSYPSVQAQERNAMLHKIVGDRSGPTIPMQTSFLVQKGSGIPRAA